MTNKKKYICDYSEGQTISDIFALSQAQRKDAKNGPYWQLTLTDRSGSIEARIWHPHSQHIEGLKPEQFVAVTGQLASFKDKLQMNVTELVLVDPNEAGLNMTDFLPSSKIPPETILTQIEQLLAAELRFKPWQALCARILNDDTIRTPLLSAPGAKSIHHAYAGGLLEHTLAIMRICRALAELYPRLDKEILLVAALFHDMGKAFELSHGISRDYTDKGRLLGHIQIGLEVLEPFLRKTKDLPQEMAMHLKHMIISHHGELAFGSPCVPQTIEAFILHYADNMDSKINTVQGALTTADGEDMEGWSEYHRTLGRYLFQPMRTPEQATISKAASKPTIKNETRPDVSPLLRVMGLCTPSSNDRGEESCS